MGKFENTVKSLLGENMDSGSIIVKLQLSIDSVRKIERTAEADIKSLLEDEINNNPEAFIEMMGYDNW